MGKVSLNRFHIGDRPLTPMIPSSRRCEGRIGKSHILTRTIKEVITSERLSKGMETLQERVIRVIEKASQQKEVNMVERKTNRQSLEEELSAMQIRDKNEREKSQEMSM